MASPQPFEPSVRPVLFETGIEDFQYATHGGSFFLVEFEGQVFGITCWHVFKDFEIQDLVVSECWNPQQGARLANVRGHYRMTEPVGEIIGSDLLDLCILDFTEDITPSFFGGSAFIVSDETVASSEKDHVLQAFGALKEKTVIVPPDVHVSYGLVDFYDLGQANSDVTLRVAGGHWIESTIANLTGLSGAPVMDRTTGKLCGMVVRGKVQNGDALIYFIDFWDILKFLKTIKGGGGTVKYSKPQKEKHNLFVK